MSYTVIPAALIITLILTFVLSLFSKRPLRSFTLFFLLLFLISWSGQLWISPVGPVIWGITWVPLLMVAVFFSLLVFALLPAIPAPKESRADVKAGEGPLIVFGVFFWIILILLTISIVLGYYRYSSLA